MTPAHGDSQSSVETHGQRLEYQVEAEAPNFGLVIPDGDAAGSPLMRQVCPDGLVVIGDDHGF